MDRAAQVTGVSARPIVLPTWFLRMNAFFTSLVERVVPVPEILSSEIAMTSCVVHQNMDRTNSRTELGFEPRALDAILREIVVDDLKRLGKPLPAQLSA
jgi:hypothetical protein